MITKNDKDTWLLLKKSIDNIATEYDKIWRKRSRKIDSKFLINFIFQLALSSKKGYGIILSELWDDYESKKIKTPQNNIFSISSICEARQKFPEEIFKLINEDILTIFKDLRYDRSLKDHRVFAIDGSKVSLQKSLEKEGFKQFSVTEKSSDFVNDFNFFTLSAVRALGLPPFLPLL